MEYKLLVIEDDPENIDIIKSYIQSEDISITFYELDGKKKEDIIEFFFREQFHMILADHDLSMAEVDFTGTELVDDMRKGCPLLQMLILTAHEQDAVTSSHSPLLVYERPRTENKWTKLLLRIKKGCQTYIDAIQKAEETILTFSQKRALTKDETLEYAHQSNILIQTSNPNANQLKFYEGNAVADAVYNLAECIKRFEEVNRNHSND